MKTTMVYFLIASVLVIANGCSTTRSQTSLSPFDQNALSVLTQLVDKQRAEVVAAQEQLRILKGTKADTRKIQEATVVLQMRHDGLEAANLKRDHFIKKRLLKTPNKILEDTGTSAPDPQD